MPAKTGASETDKSNSFPIVGIGASAGGIDAVSKLLSALPPNTGMAFVVVLHLDPDRKSLAPEIFSRITSLPVLGIRNGAPVEPDRVYVVPHDSGIALADGAFTLHPRDSAKSLPSSIDFFLQSLARERKAKAIGIVLSGTGTDGAKGLKAIKAAGGVTFCQDPATARHEGMPRAATAAGAVDHVLSPQRIAEKLAGELAFDKATPDEALRGIFAVLRERMHVDFSDYKLTTIKRRVQRRMSVKQMKTIEDYSALLKSDPKEVKALHDDIFIHVTEFFRDPDVFQALTVQVFPALLKNHPKDAPLRIWVPGCSSGEEAYSLTIVLLEFLAKQAARNPVQVFATDISERAIQNARLGIYSRESVANLTPERLERFFNEVKNGFKVTKLLRDSVVFSRHDLTHNPPFARLDLISCRNVLIYFAAPLQKRVLPIFHYALNNGAYLLLGRSETPSQLSGLFALVDKANKIYRKDGESRVTDFRFPAGPCRPEPLEDGPAGEAAALASSAPDLHKDIDRLILSKCAPAGVVIDRNAEILQVRGQVGAFLELPPGQVSVNLLKMLRPELSPPLRLMIQAAKKENTESDKTKVSFRHENKRRTVRLQVLPVNPLAAAKDRRYLVLFEALEPASPALARKSGLKSSSREKLTKLQEQYIAQLQLELEALKDHQQSLTVDFDSTREELTSTNEEFQSTNEELQSTNEELETAKEELQAANEELTTTNDELQSRNLELNAANAALASSEERYRLMIESVKDYAIFRLDCQGRVATWNEGARRFKGYEASEIIGQHFSKFYSPEDLKAGKPEMELKVARSQGRFEEEGWRVRKDGSRFWASVTITAIRDAAGELLGFGKVTRDLTERKRMEDELLQARDQLEARVVERTRELDRAVRVRDDFLSIASHELKTPLTSLKLQTQMRKRMLETSGVAAFTPEQITKMVETDEREIGRITHLMDNMLDVKRLNSGKLKLEPEPLDLSALVREVLERYEQQLVAAGCPASLEAPDPVTGTWDRYQLEQVFTNLLTNAMKYGARKPIFITVAEAGAKARLHIRDQGIGIAEENQTKIFEQFERVPAEAGQIAGLGLGLYIVRQIVEAHGGSVSVQSRPGHGSTFTVELPLNGGAR